MKIIIKIKNTTLHYLVLIFLTIILVNTPVQSQSYDIIASGKSHSLSINSDGTLWAWGSNENGQLGTGNSIQSNTPTQIGVDTDWFRVSSRSNFSVAIKTDGTLWAWGDNLFGQLGNSNLDDVLTPTQIGTDNDWIEISCGAGHVIALKSDGTLWAWGSNSSGQLGNGTFNLFNNRNEEPTQIETDNDWESISTSSSSSFAIKTDGSLWSWGGSTLGYPAFVSITTPTRVGTGNNWKRMKAGRLHALAIKTDGTLWAWGINNYGQLGNGTYGEQGTPIQVGTDTDWNIIACGYRHSFAIKTDGTLWAWGNNAFGQSNINSTINSNIPVLFNSDTNWLNVSGGETHTIAQKNDNTVSTWGNNYNGQLGINNPYESNTPTRITSLDSWDKLASGGNHVIAQNNDGKLYFWGFNNFSHYTFLNIYDSTNLPIAINQDTNWQVISSGLSYNHMIKSDGSLWAWGNNSKGQLGDGDGGSIADIEKNPIKIGSDNNWNKVECGVTFTMAIKTDGTLWAWGTGALGNGTEDEYLSPIQIGTDVNWSKVSVGREHTLAIKSDGTLWAWGKNNNGSLGNNTMFTHELTPIQIGSDTNWAIVTAGKSHSLAIKTDGTLWAWGLNGSGVLGFSGLRSLIPKQVGIDNDWVSVKTSSSGLSSLAIKSDGTLWAWGDNENGQLGNGTFDDTQTPTQIGTDTNWKEISVGSQHTIALKTDNSLWVWGSNFRGQFGIRLPVSSVSFNTLSIDNVNGYKKDITFFPNPTSDFINIVSKYKVTDVEVFSILGIKITVTLKENTIDISNLLNGLYIVRITTSQGKKRTFNVLKK